MLKCGRNIVLRDTEFDLRTLKVKKSVLEKFITYFWLLTSKKKHDDTLHVIILFKRNPFDLQNKPFWIIFNF